VLTEEEFEKRASEIKNEEDSLLAEIDVFTADVTTPCAIRCPTSPTPHWQETGKPSRQASLIIDPADGRLPPLSAEGLKRQADLQAEARARRERLQGREADTYLDRSLYDRCITRGVMGSLLPTIYNNGNEIVQAPGVVVIRNEMIHEARVVPLDGRPHLPGGVKSYMGDSRGHWEGNTLVIETTNFNGKLGSTGNPVYSSTELTIVERVTRVDADVLRWDATISDPKTYTRPFTISIPYTSPPGYQVLPYECHEGNLAILQGLGGERAEDRALEADAKKGIIRPRRPIQGGLTVGGQPIPEGGPPAPAPAPAAPSSR